MKTGFLVAAQSPNMTQFGRGSYGSPRVGRYLVTAAYDGVATVWCVAWLKGRGKARLGVGLGVGKKSEDSMVSVQ